MKKILLFFAAVICAAASWAADVVTATVSDKQLTVNLENETLFCAFQMDIALPAGVGVEDVALNVNRLDEGTTTIAGAANGNFEIRYNVLSDGTLRVLAYNLANRELKLSAGALFTVTLDKATEEEMTIDNILFVDKARLEEHRLNNANVEKADEYELGDVNCDGSVDIFDIDDLISYILGEYPEEDPFSETAADCDPDEDVNIFDVDALIELVLGE